LVKKEAVRKGAHNRWWKSTQERVVDLLGSPPAGRGAAMQQYFHEPDHARVVDLDAGKLRGSHRDG
jgi:hypothetical protein